MHTFALMRARLQFVTACIHLAKLVYERSAHRLGGTAAAAARCHRPTESMQDSFQAFLAAFRAADSDGRGLSYVEFQTMLTPLSLTELQLQSLMHASDFNTDGRITYAEFVPLAGQLSTAPSAASQAARLDPYPSQRPPSVYVPHSPVHSVSKTVRSAPERSPPKTQETSHSPPTVMLGSEPCLDSEAWTALNAHDTAAFLAREHGRVVHLLLGASAGLTATEVLLVGQQTTWSVAEACAALRLCSELMRALHALSRGGRATLLEQLHGGPTASLSTSAGTGVDVTEEEQELVMGALTEGGLLERVGAMAAAPLPHGGAAGWAARLARLQLQCVADGLEATRSLLDGRGGATRAARVRDLVAPALPELLRACGAARAANARSDALEACGMAAALLLLALGGTAPAPRVGGADGGHGWFLRRGLCVPLAGGDAGGAHRAWFALPPACGLIVARRGGAALLDLLAPPAAAASPAAAAGPAATLRRADALAARLWAWDRLCAPRRAASSSPLERRLGWTRRLVPRPAIALGVLARPLASPALAFLAARLHGLQAHTTLLICLLLPIAAAATLQLAAAAAAAFAAAVAAAATAATTAAAAVLFFAAPAAVPAAASSAAPAAVPTAVLRGAVALLLPALLAHACGLHAPRRAADRWREAERWALDGGGFGGGGGAGSGPSASGGEEAEAGTVPLALCVAFLVHLRATEPALRSAHEARLAAALQLDAASRATPPAATAAAAGQGGSLWRQLQARLGWRRTVDIDYVAAAALFHPTAPLAPLLHRPATPASTAAPPSRSAASSPGDAARATSASRSGQISAVLARQIDASQHLTATRHALGGALPALAASTSAAWQGLAAASAALEPASASCDAALAPAFRLRAAATAAAGMCAGVLAPQQELQREIANLRRLAQQHDAALEDCRGAPSSHRRRLHRKLSAPSARHL